MVSLMANDKRNDRLLQLAMLVIGLLGLVLLRWTPVTGGGILLFGLLLIALIVTAVKVSHGKTGGQSGKRDKTHDDGG